MVLVLVWLMLLGRLALGRLALAQAPEPEVWQPESTDSFNIMALRSLWDGEKIPQGGEYLTADAAAHSGAWCGSGATDAFRKSPSIQIPITNLSDTSPFNEVWFWLRCESDVMPPLQPVQITGKAWQSGGNIATQTATALVGKEWTLVRLKLSDLDAGNGALGKVQWWKFESAVKAGDTILGYPRIYVDDVWAVKVEDVPEAVEPTPDPVEEPTADPEPDPGTPAVEYGALIPMGGTAVYDQVGDDGSVRRWTWTITVGPPVITVIPAPAE